MKLKGFRIDGVDYLLSDQKIQESGGSIEKAAKLMKAEKEAPKLEQEKLVEVVLKKKAKEIVLPTEGENTIV